MRVADEASQPSHITTDPTILDGKPIVRGTRIPVDLVLGLLDGGASRADILGEYPHLTDADIEACVAFGRKSND